MSRALAERAVRASASLANIAMGLLMVKADLLVIAEALNDGKIQDVPSAKVLIESAERTVERLLSLGGIMADEARRLDGQVAFVNHEASKPEA